MDQYECIELVNLENVAVIKFKDKKIMDPARIEQMGLELLALADSDKGRNLLINFENVRFFSSAAMNKLIVLEKRIRSGGGQIRLRNLSTEVRDLFNYTKLDTIFTIEEDPFETPDS